MPAQKIAVTCASAERGMTPSGVATDTGDTSCSRSPTFRSMQIGQAPADRDGEVVAEIL